MEFPITTTSEKAINNAAHIGFNNPNIAIGIAIILYEKAQKRFCFMVFIVCSPSFNTCVI